MAKPGLGHRHQIIAVIIRKRAAGGEPCWLCGREIDTRPEKDGGPPPRTRWSFSVDHVDPRSKGGKTTLTNARPAHYGCNSRRGNGTRRKTWRPRRW